jgi:SAM-dependent methyltransferase
VSSPSAETASGVVERLLTVFERLGIQRAHLAAGYAIEATGLISIVPDRVSSLTLVCPSRLSFQPLVPFGERLLFFHGDRGPNAATVPRAAAAIPGARAITLRDYPDTTWSDVIADRRSEIEAPMLEFLDQRQHAAPVAPVRLEAGEGELAGIKYRVVGEGPALVLLPMNLGRSQWEPLIPILAERYCTIVLGGALLGFVPSLEQRMRGAYQGIVRSVLEMAEVGPRETILEVGCGPGAVARSLARWTDPSIGIVAADVNAYFLREAEALTASAGLGDRISFEQGDAEALPYVDQRFDVCLSFTVMEEVDADRMLAEMVRVTRPGGRVGVVVRATDIRPWMNVALRPELQTMIDDAPSAGADERGCADASLYRRFVAAGLIDLRMGPRIAPNQAELSPTLLAYFTGRIVEALPPADADEFRAAVAAAVEAGTMVWAEAYHCAVGTRPGGS